jgi:hypothetical protein
MIQGAGRAATGMVLAMLMAGSLGVGTATATGDPVGGGVLLAGVGAIRPTAFTLIDFQNVPGGGNPTFGSLSTQGFTFTSEHAHLVGEPGICGFDGCTEPPTYVGEEEGGYGRPITMARDDGGTFGLRTVQGAQLFNNDEEAAAGGYPNAVLLKVEGVTVNGGTVRALFPLPDTGFAEFTIPMRFCRVVSVTFSGVLRDGSPGGFGVDNVAVMTRT